MRAIKIWHFVRYLLLASGATLASAYLLPWATEQRLNAEGTGWRVVGTALSYACQFGPGVVFGGCLLYGYASWQVFVRTGSPVSSNVNAIIKRKIESSKWTRYADLQVHRKIASVFGAIYTAWLHESQKGQFKGGD